MAHLRTRLTNLAQSGSVFRGALAVAGTVALVSVAVAPGLAPFVAVAVAATALAVWSAHGGGAGLQVDQIERLRRAELALGDAADFTEAAHELADHALALLKAPAAVVLIEGLGDTVRVSAGGAADVYGTGSRMRLLDDAGVPAGSIAVAARDGRPYGEADERILDALAERVSSTLHRISLFADIQSERQTLADVLGSTSDGIFSVGPDLQIRSWNPAMEAITGRSAVAAVGNHCCEVFRPVDEEGVERFGAECPGRLRAEVQGSILQVARGDEERWLTCSFSPMSDGGYVCIARDITERKQIDDEKADFLATVSHELRTPLTPIKGFLQTLQRRDRDFKAADRAKIYEVMLREEQRLERLVHQLLAATSFDRAETVTEPEPVDWAVVVAHEVDVFRRQDPAREFDLHVAAELPAAYVDEHVATQVLSNLLSNAMKYSPDGAPVSVKVQRDGDAMVRTTVIDHGEGVKAADRERIFEKFTRLGDHLTRPQQGVGLGLYIARRSAEALGGRIWVEDGPGGGAAFSFTLPAHRATTSTVTKVRSRRAPKATSSTSSP